MKHCIIFIIFLLGISVEAPAVSWITNSDEITEEWLLAAGEETGYTEHVRHFKVLFHAMKIRGFLEFGLGFSTKYFIDNSEKVLSVEFVTPGSGPEWMKFCLDLYKDCKTWFPRAYFSGKNLQTDWAPYKYLGSEGVYKAASYQPVYRKSYTSLDSSFIKELNDFVQKQVESNEIDVAFVDCGICIRGDLVQVLFDHVPIIVAHDIAPVGLRSLDDVYGYGRVQVPDNYEEIYMVSGMGTAFWVKKEEAYKDVIKALKAYAGRLSPVYRR